MDNKLITICITLVVGVILAGSVLIPVLNDATKTEKTFTNEGYYTMDEVDSTTSKIISWSGTTPKSLTVDDNTVDFSTFATNGLSYTILGSEESIIRFSYKDNGDCTIFLLGKTNKYAAIPSTTATYATVTISNGSITVASDATDFVDPSLSIGNDCYAINGNGTGSSMFVMKNASTPAYVKGDTDIKLMGVISGASANRSVAIYSEGNLDDGMVINPVYEGTWTTVEYSTPTPTYTAVNGYVDLYSLEKFEFTETIDSGDPTDVLFTYFLVPNEVTAELSQHLSPGEIALMGAIPVMVIIALVIVALGGIYFGRRD